MAERNNQPTPTAIEPHEGERFALTQAGAELVLVETRFEFKPGDILIFLGLMGSAEYVLARYQTELVIVREDEMNTSNFRRWPTSKERGK